MQTLKSISYRGGIAVFNIPVCWKEEYEPQGGATFYEDIPDSGTLRLNVLSLESQKAESANEMISSLTKSGYAPHKNGLAIKRYTKSAIEEGEKLRLHYWEIGIPVSPKSIRVAIFSFTILESAESTPATCTELQMVDTSIRSAEFSREKGVGGDYHEPH